MSSWNLLRFCGLFTGFILITPSYAAFRIVGLIRLTCIGQIHQSEQGPIGAMVCMELVEIQKLNGNSLSTSSNDDRLHLDKLVKLLNAPNLYNAEDLRKNDKAGTLVNISGKNKAKEISATHYRIDTQVPSTTQANIAYQVGDDTKAKCLIEYETAPFDAKWLKANPGYDIYTNTRLTNHLPDKSIKAMVQDGLDYGVFDPLHPRETMIQWRIIPVKADKVEKKINNMDTNDYKLKMDNVRNALKKEYSALYGIQDIMKHQFTVIRPNRNWIVDEKKEKIFRQVEEKIIIYPKFEQDSFPYLYYTGY